MRSIGSFVLLATLASTIVSVPSASAQTGSPKLEIGTRQGDYYWVVETSPDGSRKGGWVSIAVPLNAIDRNALKPLPPGAPSAETSVQAPPPPAPTTVDERLMRIEQALAGKQGPAQIQETPTVRPAALTQVSQPRPDSITPTARPQARESFWFNGGLGLGLAGCVGCFGREVGASGGLSLGGTINERVLLGVGTTALQHIHQEWMHDTDPANLQPKLRPTLRSAAEQVRAFPPSGIDEPSLARLIESLEAPWGARIERQIREALNATEGVERSNAVARTVDELGLEPYRPPDPLPVIDRDEIRLVCWMAVNAAP